MSHAETLDSVGVVSVCSENFDVGVEVGRLQAQSPGSGALVSFVGKVRDLNQQQSVSALELEHYPEMTQKSIELIVREARQRWGLESVRVIHRYGLLLPSDQIVFVGVCAPHRSDAFQACEFIMDYLKTRAPFWKKETRLPHESGAKTTSSPETAQSVWLDISEADVKSAERWGEKSIS